MSLTTSSQWSNIIKESRLEDTQNETQKNSSDKKYKRLKDLDRNQETSRKEVDKVNGGTDVTVTTRGNSIIITQGKAQSLRSRQ